jgi:hypothetical protein
MYTVCTAEYSLFIYPVIRFSSPCTGRFLTFHVASLVCLAQVAQSLYLLGCALDIRCTVFRLPTETKDYSVLLNVILALPSTQPSIKRVPWSLSVRCKATEAQSCSFTSIQYQRLRINGAIPLYGFMACIEAAAF